MKRISKLLKIRFFLLAGFLLVVLIFSLEKMPKQVSSFPFTYDMIVPPNYSEINFQREGLSGKIIKDTKQIKDIALAMPKYIVFTDAYRSSRELKKISKIYTKSQLHKIDIKGESAYFLESPLLNSDEKLAKLEEDLLSKNITYKVMRVAG